MTRKKATDFDPELLSLFDRYLHGFLTRCGKFRNAERRSTMRVITVNRLAVSFAVVALAFGFSSVAAAQSTAGHVHIGHVMDGFGNTPEGQGLLPTAIAEAEIAAQHAALAAGSTDNLEGMKRHAGHVLHAVDPGEADSGPGLGYGVKPAAAGVARHIELAAGTDGASGNITTHATHVATSANNTVQRADELIALAKQIQAATAVADAAAVAERLDALAAQLVAGHDADGDGRIGWQEGEGGLQQAEQHANLMKKGEGLP